MDREARKRDVETSNKRVTTFWIMGSRKIAIFYRLFQDRSKRKVLNVRMEGLKIWRETIPSYFSRRGSRNSFFLPLLSYRSLFHSSHFLPLSPVISNYINRKYSEDKFTILPACEFQKEIKKTYYSLPRIYFHTLLNQMWPSLTVSRRSEIDWIHWRIPLPIETTAGRDFAFSWIFPWE